MFWHTSSKYAYSCALPSLKLLGLVFHLSLGLCTSSAPCPQRREHNPDKFHIDTTAPWEAIHALLSTNFSFILHSPLPSANILSYRPKFLKTVTDIAGLDWESSLPSLFAYSNTNPLWTSSWRNLVLAQEQSVHESFPN